MVPDGRQFDTRTRRTVHSGEGRAGWWERGSVGEREPGMGEHVNELLWPPY